MALQCSSKSWRAGAIVALLALGCVANPSFGQGQENRGADWYAFRSAEMEKQGKIQEAVDTLQEGCKLHPQDPTLHFNMGVILSRVNYLQKSEEFFLRASKLKRDWADAFSNLGVVRQLQGKHEGAEQAYRQALKINPRASRTYFNLGKVYQDVNRIPEAIAQFKKAVQLEPDYYEAYATLGGAYTPLRQWHKGAAVLRDALKMNPGNAEGLFLLLHNTMHLCLWNETASLEAQLKKSVLKRLLNGDASGPGIEPYASLTHPWPVELQAAVSAWHSASAWDKVSGITPLKLYPVLQNSNPARSPVRIAFKSFDFGDHQSTYLIIGVLKALCKLKDVDFILYGLRPDDGSQMYKMLHNLCGKSQSGPGNGIFYDASRMDTLSIAQKMNKAKPNVLVDLDGHFRNSRLEIFALRPCPLQVEYPMFVGPASAGFIDFTIWDATTLPPEYVQDIRSRVIYMPGSYYVASHADVEFRPPTEQVCEQQGLPASGVIVVNHNQYYKLDKQSFSALTATAAAGNGVVWLRQEKGVSLEYMKALASNVSDGQAGLVQSIWAETSEEHLQRLACSDLSVDTVVYNSMTTACDLLWAGKPLISAPGETPVSRLAASLLKEIGLQNLIARNADEMMKITMAAVSTASKHGCFASPPPRDSSCIRMFGDASSHLSRMRSSQELGGLFNTKSKAERFVKSLRLAVDAVHQDILRSHQPENGRVARQGQSQHLIVSEISADSN